MGGSTIFEIYGLLVCRFGTLTFHCLAQYIYDFYHRMVRCLSLKSMVWLDRVLAGLGAAREISFSLSCPFHCGNSSLFPFLSGLFLGLLLGFVFGFLICWNLLQLAHPASPSSTSHPRRESFQLSRLRGYLHEQ